MPTLHISRDSEWIAIPHMEGLEVRSPALKAWHYTGASGLLGIVESSVLWASSPLTLNDASEISYGAAVVQEAWQALRDAGRDLSDSQLAYGDHLASATNVIAAAERVYFFCATRDEDSLMQWQGYSHAQGYAIQVRIAAPIAIVLDTSAYSTTVGGVTTGGGWHEIIYERQRQVDVPQELLSFLIDDVPDRPPGGVVDKANWGHVGLIASLVTRFKHRAFEGEHEVRYVAALPGGYPEKFRRGARGLVPYIELASAPNGTTIYIDRADEKPPITSLMCGPASVNEQEPVIAAAKRLLTQYGYGVEVTGSDVPYRFG